MTTSNRGFGKKQTTFAEVTLKIEWTRVHGPGIREKV